MDTVALNVPPPQPPSPWLPARRSEGRLIRIDDFIVTIADADGMQRTFRRDGDKPESRNPRPSRSRTANCCKVYTDKDIHDVTAYLVTLK